MRILGVNILAVDIWLLTVSSPLYIVSKSVVYSQDSVKKYLLHTMHSVLLALRAVLGLRVPPDAADAEPLPSGRHAPLRVLL